MNWTVPGTLALFGAAAVWQIVAVSRRCATFVAERSPVSDDMLCRAVGADAEDRPIWLAIRQAVAHQCGVAPEVIGPNERLANLSELTLVGFDVLDFAFRLEKRFGVKLDSRRLVLPSTIIESRQRTFGEFGSLVVPQLRSALAAHRPAA